VSGRASSRSKSWQSNEFIGLRTSVRLENCIGLDQSDDDDLDLAPSLSRPTCNAKPTTLVEVSTGRTVSIARLCVEMWPLLLVAFRILNDHIVARWHPKNSMRLANFQFPHT
jgi:hypothetical protein